MKDRSPLLGWKQTAEMGLWITAGDYPHTQGVIHNVRGVIHSHGDNGSWLTPLTPPGYTPAPTASTGRHLAPHFTLATPRGRPSRGDRALIRLPLEWKLMALVVIVILILRGGRRVLHARGLSDQMDSIQGERVMGVGRLIASRSDVRDAFRQRAPGECPAAAGGELLDESRPGPDSHVEHAGNPLCPPQSGAGGPPLHRRGRGSSPEGRGVRVPRPGDLRPLPAGLRARPRPGRANRSGWWWLGCGPRTWKIRPGGCWRTWRPSPW